MYEHAISLDQKQGVDSISTAYIECAWGYRNTGDLDKAKETRQKAEFATLSIGISSYENDNGEYPPSNSLPYGVSLSAFAMGAFYLVLSWFIWKRKGDGLKLLAEAFLALGVIFASMAIPFALAPAQTAAAWAL